MAKFNGKKAATHWLSLLVGGGAGFVVFGPVGAALGALIAHGITSAVEFEKPAKPS